MTAERKALEVIEKMEQSHGPLEALLCTHGRGFTLHLKGWPRKASKDVARKTLVFPRPPRDGALLMKRFLWDPGPHEDDNPGWALAAGEGPGSKTLGHRLALLGHVPLEKAVEAFPLSVVLDSGDPVDGLPGAGNHSWQDSSRIEAVRGALRRRLAGLSPAEVPPGEAEPLALLVLKAYGSAGPRAGLEWYVDILQEWIAERPGSIDPFVREADSWQDDRSADGYGSLSAFWAVFSGTVLEREMFGRVGPRKTNDEDDRDAGFLLEVLRHPEWRVLNGTLDEAREMDRTADDPRETLDRLLQRHGYPGGIGEARTRALAARALENSEPGEAEPVL
jgi:hypothetical protein